jgi:hypothetical protein
MVVKVYLEHGDCDYVELEEGFPTYTAAQIQKIAFRYVYKRREKDYNELMNATVILNLRKIDRGAEEVMLSHVN